MATSLLVLLDDIASVLDDVATMTKVATRKTAGVLGDDLALNAQQVNGVRAERELPVVWAVARGSLVNKVILVPAALAISAFAPWAVTPLLMLGGLFLCYEGFEKVWHRFAGGREADAQHQARLRDALADPGADLGAIERDRVRGAIRTDFILSAEIIVIALGTVAHAPLATRAGVLVAIGLLMTAGVYGLVAAIVKLDDAGLALSRTAGTGAWAGLRRALGGGILAFAPWLMKGLSVAGTIAMFLVGGGILAHGLPGLLHRFEALIPGLGPWLATPARALLDVAVGLAAGAAVLAALTMARRLAGPRLAGR